MMKYDVARVEVSDKRDRFLYCLVLLNRVTHSLSVLLLSFARWQLLRNEVSRISGEAKREEEVTGETFISETSINGRDFFSNVDQRSRERHAHTHTHSQDNWFAMMNNILSICVCLSSKWRVSEFKYLSYPHLPLSLHPSDGQWTYMLRLHDMQRSIQCD